MFHSQTSPLTLQTKKWQKKKSQVLAEAHTELQTWNCKTEVKLLFIPTCETSKAKSNALSIFSSPTIEPPPH